jgi:predicted molibdopterin-dependent oxidoreductase YjgC
VGVIASGHCSNEEGYLAQKFARATLGTNNVDQPGRLDHAANVEAMLRAFGIPAMTNPIADIALAGCLLVVGSAAVESHEITALRIKKAVRNGAKLIVVDPRRTSLERFAYLYLQPRPGSDLALLNGMLRVIVDEKLFDKAYVEERCDGFEELVASLRDYDPARVSKLTGIPAEDIVAAARIYASGGEDKRYQTPASWLGTLIDPGTRPGSSASCIVYGTGATQQRQGTATVQALANLAMVTGNLGRLGGGLCPRVGQHNVQGSVDMGVWPDLLPGHRRVEDGVGRAYFAEHWHATVPDNPGLGMLEMLESARRGKLKALYVIGANPLRTAPDAEYVRECLAKLELLVVQELFPTEMVAMAHAVLPAAAIAEKDGTYTNGERRVQLARMALSPAGNSRPDWQIIADLARRVATRLDRHDGARFDYQHPGEIMAEIASLVPAYHGIGYERLRYGGVQWPCSDQSDPGTDVLFVDGFPRGRGTLIPTRFEEDTSLAVPKGDTHFPLLLITGSEMYHANTGALTRRSKATAKFKAEARLELHPDEAAKLGVERGEQVRVISAQSEVVARVEPNEAVPQGLAFLPVHYAECPVNALFPWPRGAELKQPQLKAVAVRVEKAIM